jgi:hypothetical protein
MKTSRFLVWICTLLCSLTASYSQNLGTLKAGISGNIGREYYKIRHRDFAQEFFSSDSKTSDLSVGASLWLEKTLSKHFSIVSEFDYHYAKTNDNVVVGTLSRIAGPIKETYHSIALTAGGRYYLPIDGNLRVFADAGIKVDKMIHFQFRHAHLTSSTSMPDHYGFANPGMIGSVGFFKGRWGLAIQYEYYLRQSESKIVAYEAHILQRKRTVSRQDILLKLNYALLRTKMGRKCL